VIFTQKEKSCGAVLFTEQDGVRKYVLVGRGPLQSGRDCNCGFPKGHAEKNETERETALREIKEETCIDARIIEGFKKEINYVMPNGVAKEAVYFLASYKNQEPKKSPCEELEVLLLPFAEAIDALTFESAKEILRGAENFLNTQT